ncbi:MAG: hypothetical protein PG981_000718 [Wolbachia endosymbiont of Ctenocephalides orientis wCori]|nr:MAG: hypothetical protein PG981_000718 [Wolbachia endosymbiont of Ctenocephalides orientis wCori]
MIGGDVRNLLNLYYELNQKFCNIFKMRGA